MPVNGLDRDALGLKQEMQQTLRRLSESEASQTLDRIRRDLIASIVSGLARTAVPALLAVALYPVLLRAGGLSLVGTWGVLQLIVIYLGLCTAGLPSLITRTLAAGEKQGDSVSTMIEVVLGGYLATGAALVSGLVIFAGPLWQLAKLPESEGVTILIGTTATAGVVGNMATVYMGLLIGTHRLHISQVLETVSSVVQFSVALSFIVAGYPYAGLALSVLAAKATLLALAAVVTRRRAREHFTLRPRIRLSQFLSLLVRARGFTFIDAGYTLLQPVVRALIVVMAGPSELAIFDIGNRLPVVIRNLFVGGLMALFPAVTTLSAEGRFAAISQLMQASTRVVVFLVVAPLAAYLMIAKPLLFLWIGDTGVQVLGVTIVIAIWQIITAYNVPFYFALQALGAEAVVASNVWLHIALIVPGCVILTWTGVSAIHFALLILISGAISQVQLYVQAQSRGRLLAASFSTWRDYALILVSLAFVAGAASFRVDATDAMAAWRNLLTVSASFFSLWVVSGWFILRMKVQKTTRPDPLVQS